MLRTLKLGILLLGLTLLLSGPACEASSLGLTVHVVPLDSDGGNTVRAHFTAIAPSPCPDLSGLCAEGEDCQVHATSSPFTGSTPGSGWCVRQWQKNVPSNYNGNISLGSSTTMYVSMKAGPKVRENSGRLNHPAFVALPPPLRARVNCPHHFHLSAKDLDGDKVQCRFARPEQGECLGCTQHSFIKLDEEKCMLNFTGKASAGQYFIHLMAEDLIPAPKSLPFPDNAPLSSVPVHLSLTVEESTSSCSDEPVASSETPKEDATLFVLPYQEKKFDVHFMSQLESVLEVAVVGPPELFRVGFKSIGPLSMMTMAWVRSENNLPRLLPICFAANTESLQSEPRCVWLLQRQMRTLPAGTELTCEKTEMILVLPVTSLTNINLGELQLNSPTCPVSYNDTHLTARISLTGCGTKTLHAGSELVFTNTLQSVRPYMLVSRRPLLILPLACRIPGSQLKGPQYKITMPTEEEVFGEVSYELAIYLPGEGPMAEFTRLPRLMSIDRRAERVRRDVEVGNDTSASSNSSSLIGSRINQLDLYVLSNCSLDRAELLVSQCVESETEDFAETTPILNQGCSVSNSTLEVVISQSNSRVFRLDLSNQETRASTMYVQCTVSLCIATLPSQKCPDLCSRSIVKGMTINSVFTKSYTIKSGPVSLVYTTPQPLIVKATAPATTIAAATTTISISGTTTNNTTSHAPEKASSTAAGMILTTICLFLQSTVLH